MQKPAILTQRNVKIKVKVCLSLIAEQSSF